MIVYYITHTYYSNSWYRFISKQLLLKGAYESHFFGYHVIHVPIIPVVGINIISKGKNYKSPGMLDTVAELQNSKDCLNEISTTRRDNFLQDISTPISLHQLV